MQRHAAQCSEVADRAVAEANAVARLRALVTALPEAAAADARIVETHISLLLLSGAHAWKFKKPVRMPFVDLTALAKRARLCRAEVSLNRRLAPDLYLGVDSVTGTRERPRLGGGGRVIEPAVHMRRFAERDEALRALEDCRLTTAHLRRFGADIAEFHAHAPLLPLACPFARATAIAAAWKEDIAALTGLARGGRAVRIQALNAAWVHALRQARPTIAARRRTGFVRACHGDLHLGNLVLLSDRLTAFDCIEFNDEFRYIDTCDEVAFLYMDLERVRRPLLARAFLDGYLQVSGDYRGLGLLRLFAAYRASVRAKVASLRLTQPDAGGERRRLLADVDLYLATAARLLEDPRPGRLLLMHGLSGAGKSRVAAALAANCGCLMLRSDVERRRHYAVDESAGRHDAYTALAVRRTYQRLRDQAGLALRAGFDVIVDATFLATAERARFLRLGAALDSPTGIVDVCAPFAVLEKRVAARAARGDDVSQADIAVLHQQRERQQPLSEAERRVAVRVRTDRPWNADSLRRRLRNRLASAPELA